MAATAGRIRWDRVGRGALLLVLLGVVYLYIGPARAWVTAYGESGERRKEVAQLKERNRALKQRADQLRQPGTLELEARRLGMVREGERAYVVELPPAR